MAIRDDFFTALSKGAKWDVGVSINRTNPLPLDQYSVFQSEDALDTYISGAFSYPGQIVSVVGESATTVYYLDQEKNKQPVGIIPSGDSKTIEVTAAGAISLLGASGAANGTLPMIDSETGKLTWKTLEDIGAGDGNDNTTYEITPLENDKNEVYGISIKTLFNGQPITDEDGAEIPATVIDFDVYTKSEIDAKIDAIDFVDSDELTEALKPYATTEALALKANSADVYTKTEVDNEIDAAVNSLLGEDVSEAYDTFKELQLILEGDESGAEGIIDQVAANKAAIDILNGNASTAGSVDKKIADAISAENLSQYATDEELTAVANAKADKATTLAGYGITDTYTSTQIDELINNINEGNQESAGAVSTRLESYITSNDTRVGNIETKLNTVEENAEKNIIEIVKLNGTALEVSEADHSVDVIVTPTTLGVYTKSETDAEVKKATDAAAAAQSKADEAAATAAANTTSIVELTTTVGGHTETINNHAGRIATLEEFKTSHSAAYDTLNEIVTGHTTQIAQKADKTALEAAVARIAANESSITTITGTTIPGLETEIGKKANSADVYNKTEVDNLVASAVYDDTTIKADIKKNTDAIAILNGDDQTAGSVDYKIAQEVAKILNDNDTSDIDTLEEIAAWITSDTTGAAKMNADIAKNTAAITALQTAMPGIATTTTTGLVMASETENGVTVDANGAMSVYNLNVNKLTQTEGESLILYGGTANS